MVIAAAMAYAGRAPRRIWPPLRVFPLRAIEHPVTASVPLDLRELNHKRHRGNPSICHTLDGFKTPERAESSIDCEYHADNGIGSLNAQPNYA